MRNGKLLDKLADGKIKKKYKIKKTLMKTEGDETERKKMLALEKTLENYKSEPDTRS